MEVKKYIGKDGVIGLVNGNVYETELDKEEYSYRILITHDFTLDKEMDKCIEYSNFSSMGRSWENEI